MASSCRALRSTIFFRTVPLLGPLLTGGKNGGVFAISYSLDGPLDALKTDINMMAAMTSGALRELFLSDAPTLPTGRAP